MRQTLFEKSDFFLHIGHWTGLHESCYSVRKSSELGHFFGCLFLALRVLRKKIVQF